MNGRDAITPEEWVNLWVEYLGSSKYKLAYAVSVDKIVVTIMEFPDEGSMVPVTDFLKHPMPAIAASSCMYVMPGDPVDPSGQRSNIQLAIRYQAPQIQYRRSVSTLQQRRAIGAATAETLQSHERNADSSTWKPHQLALMYVGIGVVAWLPIAWHYYTSFYKTPESV